MDANRAQWAGPELDALVAEKVMGCKSGVVFDGLWICECDDPANPSNRPHGLSYSTSISAALEVVEKLALADKNRPLLFSLFVGWPIHADGEFKAHASFTDSSDRVCDGWAATAPHAICLAAIKAVGAL